VAVTVERKLGAQSAASDRVKVKRACQTATFAARAFDPDPGERRGGPSGYIPKLVISSRRLPAMNPFKKRKILDVSSIARRDDTHRNQVWTSILRCARAPQARPARASLSGRAEQRQILHHPFSGAVMPAREAHEWNILTRIPHAGTWRAVVCGQAKLPNAQTGL
jgi:hypothetical protein